MKRSPLQVLPQNLASALGDTSYWFVIGGQAVRCFLPYRPSRDADFGVSKPKDLKSLLTQLRQRGSVEILETDTDTIHLNWDGIDVSIFVLPNLVPHVEDQSLTVTGILAGKTHAILDRGTRRDFFDLYVMLQLHNLGILECLNAVSCVYASAVNQGLFLRAFAYFEDAENEPALPGEGSNDWQTVKDFFARAVAALIVPPTAALQIQSHVVDVRDAPAKPNPPPSRRRN